MLKRIASVDSWSQNPPDNIYTLAKVGDQLGAGWCSTNISSHTQPGCDLFFCRGGVLEDGLDLVQNYPAGSVVDMEVDFLVLHSGWAVSTHKSFLSRRTLNVALVNHRTSA